MSDLKNTTELINIQKKFNALDLRCPECNSPFILRQRRFDGNLFYGCSKFPECKETHGAHPTGEPLGIPGDKETIELCKKTLGVKNG